MHGHLYVLMDASMYNERTTKSYTDARNPGTVTFVPGADDVALAQEKVNHSVAAELFHTQEDVFLSLRNAIIANVPKDIVIELKDLEYDYDKVHPRTLLTHIITNAKPESVLNAKQLKALHDTALTFDGNKNLATQFVAIRKSMDELKRIHDISTSETEMMMEWLFSIKQQTDFEDKANEWREKTKNNTFHNFIRFFADRDKRVRRLAKLRPKATADAGYSSVASIRDTDLEERMTDNINDSLIALALTMDESLHQAVPANKAKSPTPPASRDRSRSPAPTRAPSPAMCTNTAILETLKAIEARIVVMEKRGGGGGRRRANRRERAERVIDPNATK